MRKDICLQCGFTVLENGETISANDTNTHPYWHEIEWAICTICNGNIWLGQCYNMNESFPDVQWGK